MQRRRGERVWGVVWGNAEESRGQLVILRKGTEPCGRLQIRKYGFVLNVRVS